MAIYFSALLVCDRCDAELRMDDVSSESEVEQRLRMNESKWADDEDGQQVCGDCWVKWDAREKAKAASAVATPSRDSNA